MDFVKSIGKSIDSAFTSHKDADPFFSEFLFFVVHDNAAYVCMHSCMFACVLTCVRRIKDTKARAETKVKDRMGACACMTALHSISSTHPLPQRL